MICLDASVIIPWLNGEAGTDQISSLIANGAASIAPVTVTELFSDKDLNAALDGAIEGFRILPIEPGYWERAGTMRATLKRAGRKAPMADVLIAQSCIDADIQLLTRDSDFRPYVKLFGLKLA